MLEMSQENHATVVGRQPRDRLANKSFALGEPRVRSRRRVRACQALQGNGDAVDAVERCLAENRTFARGTIAIVEVGDVVQQDPAQPDNEILVRPAELGEIALRFEERLLDKVRWRSFAAYLGGQFFTGHQQ